MEQAEVGDLILCQTKRKNTTLSRPSRISHSNPYVDKIALVVKLQTDIQEEKNEIYVMRVGTEIE